MTEGIDSNYQVASPTASHNISLATCIYSISYFSNRCKMFFCYALYSCFYLFNLSLSRFSLFLTQPSLLFLSLGLFLSLNTTTNTTFFSDERNRKQNYAVNDTEQSEEPVQV